MRCARCGDETDGVAWPGDPGPICTTCWETECGRLWREAHEARERAFRRRMLIAGIALLAAGLAIGAWAVWG